jgi:erythromycin esterase-like protein
MQREVILLTSAIFAVIGCQLIRVSPVSTVNAAVNRDYLWGREPTIPVCLENPENADPSRWTIVRDTLKAEYNSKTPVSFTDFSPCPSDASGFVRVTVADERPRVGDASFFGPGALGKEGAVVMNLTFQNYRSDLCSGPGHIEQCIRSYALHEFGHLLGLMHEHERSDNACPGFGDTYRGSGDFWSTSWGTNYDPESIMNYCMNAKQLTSNTPVTLSDGDVAILKRLYGRLSQLPSYLEDLEDSIRGNGPFNSLMNIADKKPHLAFAELRHQSDFRDGKSIVHAVFFKMMKKLILEKNYSVVSFELPWRDMDVLNEFIQGRTESHNVNLSAFTTPELKEFLSWLREHNKSSDQKVELTGFDVQHQEQQDFEFIVGQMERAELLDANGRQELVTACINENPNRNACLESLGRLAAALKQSSFPANKDRDFLELAIVSRQVEEQLKTIKSDDDFTRAFNARDQAMAQAYLTLYKHRYAGRRVLSYGAFLHMAKATTQISSPLGTITSFGSHIYQALGSDYGVIGNLAKIYTMQVAVGSTLPDGSPTETRPILTLESEGSPAIDLLAQTDRFLLFATLSGQAGTIPQALSQRQRFLAVPNVADLKIDPTAIKDGRIQKDVVGQISTILSTQRAQNYEMSLSSQLDAVVYFYRDGRH